MTDLQDSFAKNYGDVAANIGNQLGVNPNLVLAQLALETGYGKSIVPGTNNLGNIKDFSGGGVAAVDNETGTTDKYRQFNTIDDFANHYVGLMQRNYPGVVGSGDDANQFTAGLSGYAEDPSYAGKIKSIYQSLQGSNPLQPEGGDKNYGMPNWVASAPTNTNSATPSQDMYGMPNWAANVQPPMSLSDKAMDVVNSVRGEASNLGTTGKQLVQSLIGGALHLAPDSWHISDSYDDLVTKSMRQDELDADANPSYVPQTTAGKVAAGVTHMAPVVAATVFAPEVALPAFAAQGAWDSGKGAIDAGDSLGNAQAKAVGGGVLNTVLGEVLGGTGGVLASKLPVVGQFFVPSAADTLGGLVARGIQGGAINSALKPVGASIDQTIDALTGETADSNGNKKQYDYMPGIADFAIGSLGAMPHAAVEYAQRNKLPGVPTQLSDGSQAFVHSDGKAFSSPDAANSFINANGLDGAGVLPITAKMWDARVNSDKLIGYGVKVADAMPTASDIPQTPAGPANNTNLNETLGALEHAGNVNEAIAALSAANNTMVDPSKAILPGDKLGQIQTASGGDAMRSWLGGLNQDDRAQALSDFGTASNPAVSPGLREAAIDNLHKNMADAGVFAQHSAQMRADAMRGTDADKVTLAKGLDLQQDPQWNATIALQPDSVRSALSAAQNIANNAALPESYRANAQQSILYFADKLKQDQAAAAKAQQKAPTDTPAAKLTSTQTLERLQQNRGDINSAISDPRWQPNLDAMPADERANLIDSISKSNNKMLPAQVRIDAANNVLSHAKSVGIDSATEYPSTANDGQPEKDGTQAQTSQSTGAAKDAKASSAPPSQILAEQSFAPEHGKISLVDPNDLRSVGGEGLRAGTIGKGFARSLQVMGAALGKRVHFYRQDGAASRLDGFAPAGHANDLFLNVGKGDAAWHTILGHEFFHSMPEDIKAEFVKAVKPEISSDDFAKLVDHVNQPHLDENGQWEEVAADLFGNRFSEAGFWDRVLDRVENPTIAYRLFAYIRNLVDKIGGLAGEHFKADFFVKDLGKVRVAAESAFHNYMDRELSGEGKIEGKTAKVIPIEELASLAERSGPSAKKALNEIARRSSYADHDAIDHLARITSNRDEAQEIAMPEVAPQRGIVTGKDLLDAKLDAQRKAARGELLSNAERGLLDQDAEKYPDAKIALSNQRNDIAERVGKGFKALVGDNKDSFQFRELRGDKDLQATVAQTRIPMKVTALGRDAAKSRDRSTEQFKIKVPDGGDAYVYRYGRDVQLDVSDLKSGSSRGTAVYQSVASWAHENGYTFIGDEAGITHHGMVRRTENMISSILRYGDSYHVKPHDMQKDQLGLQWSTGDHERNLGELLVASYNHVKSVLPEIDSVTPTEHGDFERNGDLFTADDFKRLARLYERREHNAGHLEAGEAGPVGISTLTRAAITGELLRRTSEGNEPELYGQRAGARDRRGTDEIGNNVVSKALYSNERGKVDDDTQPITERENNASDSTKTNSAGEGAPSSSPAPGSSAARAAVLADYRKLATGSRGFDQGGDSSAVPEPYRLGHGRSVHIINGESVNARTWTVKDNAGAVFNSLGHSTPDFLEISGPNAANVFHDAISDSKQQSPHGAAVYVYSPDEYSGMKMFLSKDGNAGFALKPDGDIVSVFSKNKTNPSVAQTMLHFATQMGGRKLDAFDTKLPHIYAHAGFGVTSRMKWSDEHAPEGWDKETFGAFNYGEPDVVFMAYDKNRRLPYQPGEGDYTDDYDSAVASQVPKYSGVRDAIIASPLGELSKHPEYAAAKSGDDLAAERLVRDVVKPEFIDRIRNEIGDQDAIVQPVYSIEKNGKNWIPVAAAASISEGLGLHLGTDILQSSSPKRTLLGGLDRIFNRPTFDGPVEKGKSYFLIDDNLTQGGTFAALRDHIEQNGGHVIGAATLTGKQYSAKLALSDRTLNELREKHGDIEKNFRSATGRGFDSLTESEARYLANFKQVDTLRNRIVSAGMQGSGRENAEGISQDTSVAKRSVARNAPTWAQESPELLEASRKAGIWGPQNALQQRVNNLRENWKDKAIQGAVDQFAPLKKLGMKQYVLARMAGSGDSLLEATLHHGLPYINDAGAADVRPDDKGFVGVMKQLGEDPKRFLSYVVGKRAERLMSEGRENNFSRQEIDALTKLNQGTLADGRARPQVYAKALRDFNEYQNAVLDMAEKSGIINKEARASWQNDFYVPFYRQAEEDAQIKGPKPNLSGLVNPKGIKQLKGGAEALSDPLSNTLLNWQHLISASLKNNAAKDSLETAERMGVAQSVPSGTKGSVYVMENGQQKHYAVDDPFVYKAITSLDPAPLSGVAMKIMSQFKHVLTVGTTAAPAFRIAHTIREQLTSVAANKTSYNIIGNWVSGFKLSARSNPLRQHMLAGGAFMQMTGHGDRADQVHRIIMDGIADPDQVLDTTDKIKNALGGAWHWWKEVGERSDEITRANLYKQVYERHIGNGDTQDEAHLMASYAARDVMDFGLRGTWNAVRLITGVVPFMNARLQGMYKLGRGAVEDPKRFAAVMGATSLATILLSQLNKDDEDIQALPEYVRDSYWVVRLPGMSKALFIPKPFEVGAMATIADRGMEALMNGLRPEDQQRFMSRLMPIVGSQLSMNPVPQLAMPLVEAWANKDLYRGSPIETAAMQNRLVQDRIGPNTSAMAQLAGRAGVLSPVMIDHLIDGYFGWLGTSINTAASVAAGKMMGLPDRPEMRAEDIPVTGRFFRDIPSDQSRYLSEFYDQQRGIAQIMGSIHERMKEGDLQGASDLASENAPQVAASKMMAHAQKSISSIDNMIRLAQESRTISTEEKRTQLDSLMAARNNIAKQARQAAIAQGAL